MLNEHIGEGAKMALGKVSEHALSPYPFLRGASPHKLGEVLDELVLYNFIFPLRYMLYLEEALNSRALRSFLVFLTRSRFACDI